MERTVGTPSTSRGPDVVVDQCILHRIALLMSSLDRRRARESNQSVAFPAALRERPLLPVDGSKQAETFGGRCFVPHAPSCGAPLIKAWAGTPPTVWRE